MKHLYYMQLMVLAGALVAVPSLSHSQQAEDLGKREYFVSCAVCHGKEGKGDGPLVAVLKKPAVDLTRIQQENKGVFPFDRLYQVIDGREAVAAHGPRDMPVWGERYERQAVGIAGVLLTPKYADSYVRGRIIALVGYIYTLQAR